MKEGFSSTNSSRYFGAKCKHYMTTDCIKICLESNITSKLSRTRLNRFFCLHTQCVCVCERGSEEMCLIQCSPAAHRRSSMSLEVSLLIRVSRSINSDKPSVVALQSRKIPNLLGGSKPFASHQFDIRLYKTWLGIRMGLERICRVLGHVPCPASSHFFMQARSYVCRKSENNRITKFLNMKLF